MVRAFAEELAALVSLTLFVACVFLWAAILSGVL